MFLSVLLYINPLKKQANLKTKIEDIEKGIIAQTKVKGEKSKEVERYCRRNRRYNHNQKNS